MKNFKRVISAVIALALSASTLVAVSASKFSDVDNTNNYAEAIEVLTALDIVHGYEDGSFKPEGEITRAEAATMIVGALNMMKEAQAAAGTSKFTDVNEKASWASGYVNVGVAQGFINGMNDTTFAPQDNVTYAQMCVMLTLITGYGDYAAAYGGYPTGYTTMAASAGINKGVALAADAKLQRGQVAQMLYNALTAPLLGVRSYNLNGNDYGMQDGTNGLAFKTLLAEKFEGYEADLKITDVPKTGSSLNKGEVNITLTKSAYLEKTTSKFGPNSDTTLPHKNFGVVYDEVGVDDMLNLSGKAILKLDANDRWHLVYFKASEVDKVVVKAEDYVSSADDGKNVDTDDKITFGSKNYTVSHNRLILGNNEAAGLALADFTTVATNSDTSAEANRAKIYVNGRPYQVSVTGPNAAGGVSAFIPAGTTPSPIRTQAAFNDFHVNEILELAQGEVTLIDDVTDANHVGYDKLMATVYDVAKVDAVITSNGTTTIQVTFKNGLNANVSTIRLTDDAIADGTVDLKVKNAAGESIALSSIKKGDIIAYAAPQTFGSTISDPEAIEIRVTDEKISGKVTRIDPQERTFSIGDTAYKTVLWNAGMLEIGTSYSVYLDPFGRIYDYVDVEAVADRYAVAKDYVVADNELRLILPDGTVKSYELSTERINIASTVGAVTGFFGGLVAADAGSPTQPLIYASAAGVNVTAIAGHAAATTAADVATDFQSYLAAAPAISNRVVRYTVRNSTGKIDNITLLEPANATSLTNLEYRDSTNKLGNFTIGATSDVLDATDQAHDRYAKYAASSFKDKEQYDAAVFTDANFGNTAVFAVLTRAGFVINGDSRFAVVRKAATQAQTSDGDRCRSLNVLYEGEEKDILCTWTSGVTTLNPGDAIFFNTDSDGLVESFIRVYNAAAATSPVAPGWAFTTLNAAYTYDTSANAWGFGTFNTNEDHQFVYGIVTNVTNKGVEFAVNGLEAVIPGPIDLDEEVGVGPDAFNFDDDLDTVLDSYDQNADGIADAFIDLRTATNSKVFGIDANCATYRYASTEYAGATNQWKAINIGAPTASPLSAYETGRNTSIYNLEGKNDGNGINRLTFALALIENGDIVEIYTITQ